MDSDGTLDKSDRYVISLSSKKLIEDIAFICRSLGYNCSYTIKKTGYNVNGVYKECLPSYSLTIFFFINTIPNLLLCQVLLHFH